MTEREKNAVMDRRAMKAAAKGVFKRHYWLIVVMCLIAALIGVEYTSSLWVESYEDPTMAQPTVVDQATERLGTMLGQMATGNEDQVRDEVARNERNIRDADTIAMLGRSRGVFASVLNSFSSGSILLTVSDAARSILRSPNAGIIMLIVISLIVYVFGWLFIQETYTIIIRRIMLEARTYEQVPLRRFLYPIQTGRWPHMAWTMFLTTLYLILWSFTIVGIFVKSYSYFLVPYIMAENPTMGANEAITLSRRMMKGHKWECFVMQLSFIGWHVLSALTFGLVGIFWLNGYQAAFFAEYYARLRALSKSNGVEGSERLCDEALFVRPDRATVEVVYADAVEAIASTSREHAQRPTGFTGLLADWFGITLRRNGKVDAWQRHEAQVDALDHAQDILDGRCYPGRLAPAPIRTKVERISGPDATRSYTVLNLVMMFFIFCFVGWIWEVTLAFITEGMFVNRGTLHGPWLPIYGTGGIAILVLLKKLRSRPALEFVAAMALCGAIEYFSSWYLEITHDGQRWWDYTGYFFNLNGRICAEGLLTFGLGGLAVVYLLAPALDDLLRRANVRVLTVVAAVLLVAYCCDQVYSTQHPNTGAGITDYKGSDTISAPAVDSTIPLVPVPQAVATQRS